MSVMHIQGVGRRKTASARVFLRSGAGNIVINNKPLETYFPSVECQEAIKLPLHILDKQKDYDFFIRVQGGGVTGQVGAIQLGVSRALVAFNADFRAVLKEKKFLSRDARRCERKKPGRVKARKKKPFRKR